MRTPCSTSARKRATSRSATAWPVAPTASPARPARWPTRSSPTCARSTCPGHRLGLGPVVHAPRPAARLRRGLSWSEGSRTRSPTPSTWPTATTARRSCRAEVGDEALAGQLEALADGWTAAFDPVDRPAGRLVVLRGRQVELLVPDPARHGEPHRLSAVVEQSFVELLDRFFGFGADPVKQRRANDRARTRCGSATRSTGSKG